ncbi:phage protein Gp27 family protein [Endozoicomonas gorgoniicola]
MRKAFAEEASKEVEKQVGKNKGMTKRTVDDIKRMLLGIA